MLVKVITAITRISFTQKVYDVWGKQSQRVTRKCFPHSESRRDAKEEPFSKL